MKILKALVAGAIAVSAISSAQAAVDVVEAPTGFFVPNAAQTFDAPYYRGNGEGWSWTHGGIAAGFTSAELNISAWDVDEASGEIDEIYAYDNGVRTLLGTLDGADNVFAFTTFNLGANFFDDIVNGLLVEIVIDTNDAGWLVSLARSTITTDGSRPGNPNPGEVPLPAAAWLMLAGVGALVGRKKLQK